MPIGNPALTSEGHQKKPKKKKKKSDKLLLLIQAVAFISFTFRFLQFHHLQPQVLTDDHSRTTMGINDAESLHGTLSPSADALPVTCH